MPFIKEGNDKMPEKYQMHGLYIQKDTWEGEKYEEI